MYFAKHAINTIPNVVLQTAHTDAVGYDAHLHALLESASVLRGELQDPCELSNIKNMPGSTLALYIQMTNVSSETIPGKNEQGWRGNQAAFR